MTAVVLAARVVVISTSSAERSGAEEWKRAADVARRRRACNGRRRVVCREHACAVLVLLRAQREIIFPLSAHPLCRWGARAHSCVPVRAWEHRHSRRRPAATTTCRFVLGARQPLCENTRSRWPAPIFCVCDLDAGLPSQGAAGARWRGRLLRWRRRPGGCQRTLSLFVCFCAIHLRGLTTNAARCGGRGKNAM